MKSQLVAALALSGAVLLGCPGEIGDSTLPFVLVDARELSIHYSAYYLGSTADFTCLVKRTDSGTWLSESCSMCEEIPFETDPGHSNDPINLDGRELDEDLLTNLLAVVDGLDLVQTLTRCDRMTDNYPSYAVTITFAAAPPLTISIGGNCGPFFAAQSELLACDCSTELFGALWSIFSSIAPDLWSTQAYPHSPDQHCSCQANYP